MPQRARDLVRRSPRNQRTNYSLATQSTALTSSITVVYNTCMKHGIRDCALCSKNTDTTTIIPEEVSMILL